MDNYYLKTNELNDFTSSDRYWTSVTSHHAHAHPPTIVDFFVEPQHPPEMKKNRNKNISPTINHLIVKFSLIKILIFNFCSCI